MHHPFEKSQTKKQYNYDPEPYRTLTHMNYKTNEALTLILTKPLTGLDQLPEVSTLP